MPYISVDRNGNTVYLYPDGSVEVYDPNFNLVSSQAADTTRARAYTQGPGAVQQQLTTRQQQQASSYQNELDRNYGIQKGQLSNQTRQIANTNSYQQGSLKNQQYANETTRQDNQARIAEMTREADLTNSINQGRLGLDYVTARANMGGFKNAFQALDMDAGMSQRQDVPVYFNQLAQNVAAGGTNAPGVAGYTYKNALPQALSMNSIMGTASGGQPSAAAGAPAGTAAGSTVDPRVKQISDVLKAAGISETPGYSSQDIATLNLVGELAKQGGKNWATYYSLPTAAQDALKSGVYKIGGDPGLFDENMARARWTPGNGDPLAA